MDPIALIAAVAADLALALPRVESAVRLLDDGNTVPFIARYRKEMTGSLDEEQLRQVAERLGYRRNMEERRETILHSLEEQGVLTPELQKEVVAADTLQRLEDLYRPYKPKRRTRATIAREKGLHPLADLVLAQTLEGERDALAQPFLTDDVPTVDDAYAGARDIVAEAIADAPEVRADMRRLVQRHGTLSVAVADQSKDPKGVYQMYYSFFVDFRALRPHQTLALNRGEREGVLKVTLEVPEPEAMGILAQRYPSDAGSPLLDDLVEARKDSYSRLLFPAVEREMRRELSDMADEHAIGGLTPSPQMRAVAAAVQTARRRSGYRTGCKVAVSPTGKVFGHAHDYPDRDKEQAKATLAPLVQHGDDGDRHRQRDRFAARRRRWWRNC